MKQHALAAVAIPMLWGVLAGSSARGAAPVPIANAGFEDPVLDDGAYQYTVPGWTQGKYDVLAPTAWVVGDSGAGVYDVSSSQSLPMPVIVGFCRPMPRARLAPGT